MKAALAKIVIVLALASMSATSLGQGAPAQMDAAILDLGARLGYSLGIGGLSNWRWEQTTFADDALGCPAVAARGSAAIVGYKFQLTHDGVTYDYRVSNDSALLVYCGEIDVASVAAAAASAPQYSNRLCDEGAADGPYMRSRINAGMEVEVLGAYVNLRGQPSITADILLQIPSGWTFEITAGPDCVDGYVWWLALVNGQTGYIAEAGDEVYLVAPKTPPELPSREALQASLAPRLVEFGRLGGNFQPAHDWSSDSRFLIAPGAVGSDGAWVYDLRQPALRPQILALDEGIAALAFRPNHDQFVIGGESGALQLWQMDGVYPLAFSERLYLNAHAGAVSALAFSPGGDRLASAGHDAYTHFDVDRAFAALVWDLPTVAQVAALGGNSGLIRSMAFHPLRPDVLTIVDGVTLRNWVTGSGEGVFTVDLRLGEPVAFTALEYSRDGQLAAVALARASDNVSVYPYRGVEPIASYQSPASAVTSLAFSPDGGLLAVGAAESLFSVWDARSHELLATRAVAGAVQDISFSPDGTLIAVSTDRFSLHLFGAPLGSG